MTDEETNVVPRLLREIRAGRSTIRGGITAIERRMEDMKEDAAYALGLSAHADPACETTGRRADRMKEEIARTMRCAETLENGR